MAILATGGVGFIGSNFMIDWLAQFDARYIFVQGGLDEAALVNTLLTQHYLCAALHFADESHVNRSIFTGLQQLLAKDQAGLSLEQAQAEVLA